jgi:hypothetical protein
VGATQGMGRPRIIVAVVDRKGVVHGGPGGPGQDPELVDCFAPSR